eukprot:TRINITY_DN2887_c0_g1_i1.p1 TRINITY_DN2887_c0_g1~~TRINITY_DN2887_c0_g1_i1.p1  ORF type:complete len:1331 (-),score=389.97 TRINITY_DN2887_c0_g1_i1:4292-8146(-)
MERSAIEFLLNGKTHTVCDFTPQTTLLQYLRSYDVHMFGTKEGDSLGATGADTVTLVSLDPEDHKTLHFQAVPACRLLLLQCDSCAIFTIEGVGSIEKLNPIQKAFVEKNASQCGFCTSGFIMSLYSLMCSKDASPVEITDIEECLDGNVCRCTGYRPIGEAAEMCVGKPVEIPVVTLPEEVAFKEKLFGCGEDTVFRPSTLASLLQYLAEKEKPVLIGGHLEVYDVCGDGVLTTGVRELHECKVNEKEIVFGSSVPISRMRSVLKKEGMVNEANYLRFLGSTQIRNLGTLGGNIVSAHSVSDLLPMLMALNASVSVIRKGQQTPQKMPIKDFVPMFRQPDLACGDLLVSVSIPKRSYTLALFYKQGRRKLLAKALMNAAFVSDVDVAKLEISSLSMAFGCIASSMTFFPKTQEIIVGKKWTSELMEEARKTFMQELKEVVVPPANARMGDYKKVLMASFFEKFLLNVSYYFSQHVKTPLPDAFPTVPEGVEEMIKEDSLIHFGFTKGEEVYESSLHRHVGHAQFPTNLKSKVSGDLRYPMDVVPHMCAYAAFVASEKAHARLVSIDTSLLEDMPGVIGFTGFSDIPGRNAHSGIKNDTTVFADGFVHYVGQPIGTVLAESVQLAQAAAKCVKIEYEELPAILSIQEAMEKESYLEDLGLHQHELHLGDVEKGLEESEVVIEGEFAVGGQDHYYMETQNCVVVPDQEGRYHIYSSTQNPSKIHMDVSWALGIPMHEIESKVYQIGGGFGGKQDRPAILATAAAVTSHKFKRPVKIFLTREEDMTISGGRHPFFVKYKAGFKKDGSYNALDLLFVCDGGYIFDVTGPVLDKCIFQSQNAYTIPNFRVEGRAAKTNRVTNTAFRGFGAPQSHAIQEAIIEHAAAVLEIEPHVVREINMNKPGDVLLTGTYLAPKGTDLIRRMWDHIMETSDFKKRLEAVEEYNAKHRYTKRGISILPLKNAVNFEEDFMNQAGALVHVYSDGSVRVSHSGIEMGQGLHTKMQQIAAEVFGIPMSKVKIVESDTSKVPNTNPTAASSGADLNGPAVADACRQIFERLRPLFEAFPEKSWEDICNMAFFKRVNMSANGFCRLPTLQWHWDTKKGYTGFYYDWGCACGEVELDVLTGHFTVLRVDLLEDAGKALNPALDIGQVEGGFTQGYGYFTMEEVSWDTETGVNTITGPGEYCVPMIADAPRFMRTELMGGVPNPENVFASKSSAEAPVLTGASVMHALRHAITAARAESGLKGYFPLHAPFTCEKIRMACCDRIVTDVVGDKERAAHMYDHIKM